MQDPGAAAEEHETHTRPEKRQRLHQEVEEEEAGGQVTVEDADGDGPPPGPPPAAQLSAALAKIANHISNSTKFAKASQLLRQVMDAVDKAHSDELFAAVKAAFTHPEHATDPLLRKDYGRLMKAVNLRAEVFSKQQRAQLEVYSILALTQNELFTDDSFVFNKVIAKIKAGITELPDGDEEQEAAWVDLFPDQAAALGISAPTAAAAAAAGSSKQQQGPKQKKQPAAAAAAQEAFADFGLDALFAEAETDAAAGAAAGSSDAAPDSDAAAEQQPSGSEQPLAAAAAAAAGEKKSSKPPKLAWDAVSCCVMKKQAWLSCIETAKTHQHKLAWARTSVEILIEDVATPAAQGGLAGRFVGGQKQQLQELLKFVNAERAARRSGVNRRPGGKGTGEYQTSFEKARAEWGSADWVSARGKIGGGGDARQQNWLG